MRIYISAVVATAFFLGGCSTVMEANRPPPVNLAKYATGEKRMDVIATLGAPVSTVKDGDNSCDIYSLYTKGNNKSQKAAVILGEAGADLFTLGLFEIVATPAEALTKSKPHTVMLCYSGDESLLSVKDEGVPVVSHPPASSTASNTSPSTASSTASDTPPPVSSTASNTSPSTASSTGSNPSLSKPSN